MPKRPCARTGCPHLVWSGYCENCRPSSSGAVSERERGSAHSRGYTREWSRASKAYLQENPVCVDPYKRHAGRIVPATVTDHINAHKGDMVLFWDQSNWQGLCDGCNAYKAVRDEGGFGNPVRPRQPGAGSNVAG